MNTPHILRRLALRLGTTPAASQGPRPATPRVLFCGLALFALVALPAHAARLALVVGNDSYTQVSALKNAGNDARLMVSALRAGGFDVSEHFNLESKRLYEVVDTFEKRIQKGDEVVFYFSGHGVQLDASQMLLPTDIQAADEKAFKRAALPLLYVQDALKEARVSLLVIDACRDNPFPKQGTRSLGETRGLRPPDVVKGQAVIMSAGRNQKALDTVPGEPTQKNGLFTHEFVRVMRTPGLDVRSALNKVRDEVEDKAAKVNHEQRPSLIDDLRGNFVLLASVKPEPDPAYRPPVPGPGQGGGLNLEDLKREEENRKAWAQWQARMKADFDKTAAFEGSADLQAKAWERFLATWGQDNPLSSEDEGLRAQAQSRLQEPQRGGRRLAAAATAVSTATPQAATGTTLVGRYQLLASGSEVKDLQTGLVWQRCSVGQQWTGQTCAGEASTFNFDQAQVKALSSNGWRVPSKDELASLVDEAAGKPAIHAHAFPATPARFFWTSTPRAGNAGGVWSVDFGDGGGIYDLDLRGNYYYHVRLVR